MELWAGMAVCVATQRQELRPPKRKPCKGVLGVSEVTLAVAFTWATAQLFFLLENRNAVEIPMYIGENRFNKLGDSSLNKGRREGLAADTKTRPALALAFLWVEKLLV
jgi:hypothetical protein